MPVRPRIGQWMRIKAYMAEYMGLDARTIKRADIKTEWDELVKMQTECQGRFLSGGGTKPRRVNVVVLRKFYPHHLDDPVQDYREKCALGEVIREDFEALTQRVDGIEERQKIATKTARTALTSARLARATAESASEEFDEFRQNVKGLFAKAFQGLGVDVPS